MKYLFLLFILSCTTQQATIQKHHGFSVAQDPDYIKSIQRPINKRMIQKGKALYMRHCYKCHGALAEGDGPISYRQDNQPRNLLSIAKKVPNFRFYLQASKWKGDMPGWNPLIEESEIAYIENYIRHLSKILPKQ